MQMLEMIPKTTNDPYIIAVTIRLDAERCNSPEKYYQAAAEFTALGMNASAQACIARAQHYQKTGEETP
jgi:hypothetical protein